MELAKLFILGIAIIISVVALYFSRKSWLDTNRPLITLKISSQGMAGNIATPLTLVVENTGNRPAVDILVTWHDDEYKKAFKVPAHDERRAQFEKIYSEGASITVLANGKAVTTSFGWIGPKDHPLNNEPSTWHPESRFKMDVSYSDIDGRTYRHTMPLIMADDEGFAGGVWSEKE